MATRTALSIEEFERLEPPSEGRYELDEGELVKMTFPTPRHNLVVKELLLRLEFFVRERGLGLVFPSDTGFVLDAAAGTLRGPDVAFLTAARAASVDLARNIPGAPDLAVEVVSPADTFRDLRRKAAQYLAAGAVAVWVIDPDARETHVYESAADRPRTLVESDALECPELLPDFRLPLAELFGAVPPANG